MIRIAIRLKQWLRSRGALNFFVAGLFILVFSYLLAASWKRWGNLVVDSFYALWIPLQVLRGKILYRDICLANGFLPDYFLAFCYSLFGFRIDTLLGCCIGVVLAVSFFLYRISRFFLARTASLCTILLFTVIFAFGNYMPESGIFNFLWPYNFASVFFSSAIAGAVFFFIRAILRLRVGYFALWCLFLVLAFLSRPELALIVWCGFLVVYLAGRPVIKYPYWNIYGFLAPLLISAAIYGIFFAATGSFADFILNIFGLITAEFGDYAAAKKAALWPCAIGAGLSFLAHAAVLFCLYALWIKAAGNYFKNRFIVLAGAYLILLGLFQACLAYNFPAYQYEKIQKFPQFLSLLVILPLGIIILFRRVLRKINDKHSLALLALFVAAATMLARSAPMFYPYGGGFFLIPLALVCYSVFWFGRLVSFGPKIKPDSNVWFSLALSLCLLLPAIHLWKFSQSAYALKSRKITTCIGNIYFFSSPVADKFVNTIEYLRTNTLPSDKVVVYPYGVSLNLFSQRDNPTRFYDFSSPFFKIIPLEKFQRELSDKNITYIVIIPNQGVSGDRQFYDWLKQNYRLIKLIGPEESQPPLIAVFKKINF